MRYAVIIISGIVLASSCNLTKHEDAIQLSNELVQVNDSLNHFGKVWGDEFKVAVNTRDFTHLQEFRQNIQYYISERSLHIRAMKDVGDSGPLRQSMLDILKFEDEVILPKMKTFERFDATTPDDTIKFAFQDMMYTTTEDLAKHDVMYKLLDEYAEKNDFPKPLDK